MKFTLNRHLLLTPALALALAAPAALGDDIYTRSEKKGVADLMRPNITVRSVKDGELYYAVSSQETHRPINDISRLVLTGETAFSDAEKAFSDARTAKDEAAAKAKYAEAVSGYTKTLSSTNKPWLKEFVAARMLVAAPRSGRFDVALDAWKAMVDKDPVGADRARPSVADIDPKSQYLSNAVKALAVWANGTPKPDARRAFLGLLYDVQIHIGDTEGSQKTLVDRTMAGGTPEEIANVTVLVAINDLNAKRVDAAAERVSKVNQAALTDAGRADVAYIMAEAKAAKVPMTAPADDLKDLAIDYMKVVAGAPTSPHAGAALIKVAQIHESLKEPETALKIYQRVAAEFGTGPAGQAAQKGVERLGKSARG